MYVCISVYVDIIYVNLYYVILCYIMHNMIPAIGFPGWAAHGRRVAIAAGPNVDR